MVRFLSWWFPSKSCECLVTQWRSTESTRIVAALEVMDIFRLAAALKESVLSWPEKKCTIISVLKGPEGRIGIELKSLWRLS